VEAKPIPAACASETAMRYLLSVSGGALGLLIAALLLAAGPTAGQGRSPAVKTQAPATQSWKPPRTPDGHPDLQGVWNYSTITPLERPSELAGREFLSAEETAVLAKREADNRSRPNPADLDEARRNPGFGADLEAPLAYEFRIWWDRGTVVKTRRSSLVIDPPNGHIPPLTEDGQKRRAAEGERRRLHPADGPEDRSAGDRCLVGINSGPPMLPNTYNNNVQIFQAPGYVAFHNEMIHAVRIVPTNGRPHANVRQWAGDSHGRWDGDTLIVDTTNFYAAADFYAAASFRGASPNLHLVERFTHVGADTLLYEFTVDDPATWTGKWTAQLPMTKTSAPIYEYACHEGNYSMAGILSSARAAEKASRR
jgi:hypothetical protein